MAESSAVVKVYDPTPRQQATIKELQLSVFDMNKLSIACTELGITNKPLARGE